MLEICRFDVCMFSPKLEYFLSCFHFRYLFQHCQPKLNTIFYVRQGYSLLPLPSSSHGPRRLETSTPSCSEFAVPVFSNGTSHRGSQYCCRFCSRNNFLSYRRRPDGQSSSPVSCGCTPSTSHNTSYVPEGVPADRTQPFHRVVVRCNLPFPGHFSVHCWGVHRL